MELYLLKKPCISSVLMLVYDVFRVFPKNKLYYQRNTSYIWDSIPQSTNWINIVSFRDDLDSLRVLEFMFLKET